MPPVRALPPWMPAGAAWETRRLDIEYLRPALYGQTVEVLTSAAMTRTGTLRRTFALFLAGSPAPAELAQPICRVDTESIRCADGEPRVPAGDPLPALEPLPPLPAAPPGVFSVRRRIIWNDLDLSRRVSDAALLSFTDACGMEVVAAHGWPAERMAAQGFAIILRSHAAEFIERPTLGDEIQLSTWASDVRRVSGVRHYTITPEARRCAAGARRHPRRMGRPCQRPPHPRPAGIYGRFRR